MSAYFGIAAISVRSQWPNLFKQVEFFFEVLHEHWKCLIFIYIFTFVAVYFSSVKTRSFNISFYQNRPIQIIRAV